MQYGWDTFHQRQIDRLDLWPERKRGVSDDEQVVRRWLTEWTRLPLCETSKLDRTRDYYVRISARARPSGESLLGLARTISGQAKMTLR